MIVRDPADILQSEIHYLSRMNRYHRMASQFRRADEEQRLHLAVHGSAETPGLYPDFASRIEPYLGWSEDANVCLLRFEELASDSGRRQAVGAVVDAWCRAGGVLAAADQQQAIADSLEAAIDPGRSHTISGRDRNRGLSPTVLERIAPVRAALGYDDMDR
jgi:hypothetical protein